MELKIFLSGVISEELSLDEWVGGSSKQFSYKLGTSDSKTSFDFPFQTFSFDQPNSNQHEK